MDYNINPFIRLKICVVNGNSELIMKGLDKIIIAFNRSEISNFSQFIQKLNEIFSDYGIIDTITDKDGFQIKEFNHLQIDNIWNYLSNNDIINIKLRDKKTPDYNVINNKKNIITKNRSLSPKSSSSSSSSDTPSSEKPTKKKNSKKYINIYSSSSSKESKKKFISSSSSSSSKHKRKSSDSMSPSSSSSLSSSISKNSSNYNKSKEELLKNFKDNKKNKNLNINKKKDFYNDSIKKNYEKNYQLLGQKRKIQNFPKIDYSSFKSNKRKKNSKNNDNTNNKANSNNIKKVAVKINYELIPSNSLDDISFLQNSYPKLFNQGTNIKFKIQELLENGIGIGDYHYGTVENFNLDNKSFLIKNCNSMNEKTMMFMYQCDEDLLCVQMKDFVELWLESDKKEKSEENNNNNNYNVDIDEELTKHFIQRQIEYYFSDTNYGKDSFLKSKEDENGYIPINIIMSFNKIKMITKDKNLFINALKEKTDNKLYELNEDFSKIRKKQII